MFHEYAPNQRGADCRRPSQYSIFQPDILIGTDIFLNVVFYTKFYFLFQIMPLFRNAKFHTTVNHLKDLPDTPAEIAFVGRSNAGKSSAINALTGCTRLAYVSKTPGRTQHINFFSLDNGCYMVDLPGYGYAQVPEAVRAHWIELLGGYLKTRRQLVGLVLVMDMRHPLKELDKRMLDFFATTGKPVHILLSKADKLSKNEQIKALSAVRRALQPFAMRQRVSVQLFSSLKKQGMEEVDQAVSAWFAEWKSGVQEAT